MVLKILGSNSSGNCYILHGERQSLIIEAGVHLKEAKIALDFDLTRVAGLIATHSHGDHMKYINEYRKAGVKCYGPENMTNKQAFNLGEFRIQPLEVVHDVQTFCFLIKHDEMGLCLFASDTHYLPYRFLGLNQIIIEANYSLDILDQKVLAGHIPAVVRNRVINSHMSLDTAKDFLKANDLKKVNKIVLIHLSDGNSDAKRFKREVEELTGKPTFIADAGVEIDFNIEF